MRLQVLCSFLSQKFWCLNMAPERLINEIWDIMIFVDFQNASPRKCCEHFPANYTQLKYSCVLQTNAVRVSALISFSKILTSEHGPRTTKKWGKDTMIFVDFQSASPRKHCEYFPAYSTHLRYARVLHTNAVTASALISFSNILTSEHGPRTSHKWDMRYHDFRRFSKFISA